MVRTGCVAGFLAVLLLSGCGWVDSTGRQDNSAPKVALGSMLVDEKSTVEIDLTDADTDGNLSLVEFELIDSGASLASSCEAAFSEMAVFGPSDYAPDLSAACGAGEAACAIEFSASESDPGLYQATVPVLQKPTVLKYRLTLGDTDAATSEEEFTLCLRSISEAPIAQADAFDVEYRQTRTVDDAVFDAECGFSVRSGVMLNDSDDFDVLEAGLADNGCLDVELVDSPIYHTGTFVLSDLGGFQYQPVASAVAGLSDSFTYRLDDGLNQSDTVTVTLNIVEQGSNTPPVALNPDEETDEDTALTLQAGDLASDADGDDLELQSVALTQAAENGELYFEAGFVRYTPDADFFGDDQFSYVVRDAAGATVSGVVTVTVNSINDRPTVSVVGSSSIAFSAPGDSRSVYVDVADVETALVLLQLSATPVDAAVATASVALATDPGAPGNVEVTVLANAPGTTNIRVRANDGDLIGVDTINATVASPNTPPVAVASNDALILGGVLNFNVVTEGAVSDADNDPLELTAASLAVGSGDPTGTVTIVGTSVIQYTPGSVGNHVVEYTVSDGIDTASSTLTVAVTAPNNPPQANDTGLAATDVGAELRYDVVVSGSASDADVGDTLNLISAQFAVGSEDATGVLSVSGAEIVYTPGTAGLRVIEFEVTDGIDSATGSITVTASDP